MLGEIDGQQQRGGVAGAGVSGVVSAILASRPGRATVSAAVRQSATAHRAAHNTAVQSSPAHTTLRSSQISAVAQLSSNSILSVITQ